MLSRFFVLLYITAYAGRFQSYSEVISDSPDSDGFWVIIIKIIFTSFYT
jgi:hypothetical protein